MPEVTQVIAPTSGSSVDLISPAVQEMQPYWRIIDDLLGGTLQMRKQGELYLPKLAGESQNDYDRRLKQSVLFNALARTISTFGSKPFKNPVQYLEGQKSMEPWIWDVDTMGSDIDVFAQEVFVTALKYGLCHILVDYPSGGGTIRLADRESIGARPYGIIVNPKNVLGWRSETRNGATRLKMLRIYEPATIDDGEFGEKMLDRIRVIEPHQHRLYEKSPDSKSTDWRLVETVPIRNPGLQKYGGIPLSTLYFKRTGFMTAEPTLIDLAHLNIAHWQSYSDQRNLLHVARVPILFGRGFEEKIGEVVTIGASHMISNPNSNSDLKFVEHTGAALSSGIDDLRTLKEEMAALGIELLLGQQTGNITATQRAIDTSQADSSLVTMIRAAQNVLNEMLVFMGMWEGTDEEDVGTIELYKDFRIDLGGGQDADLLLKSRQAGEITVETFWDELRRRGILSDNFDPDKEKKLLEKEKENNMALLPPMLKNEEEEGEEGEEEEEEPE